MNSPASSVERFQRFCRLVGFDLAAHQVRIAEAILGPQREVLVVVPRGAGKTRLVAALSLWHLLTHPEPQAYVGAAARDQARVCFEYARAMARHPAVARRVTVRHNELRVD